MADFLSRATVKGDPWSEAEVAAKFLMGNYPCLYKVLVGDRPSGQDLGRLPGSVRLFTNGGEFKAVIQGKEWLFDGYLLVPKQDNIIAGIEEELKNGRIGWSVASGQANSSKKPTY